MGYAVALIAGAFLGAMLSAITNSTLVEISLNFGFAFYFGFLFLAIGSIFLYRILVTNRDQLAPGRKCVLASFATLVVVSGFICLLFEHKWFFTMSRAKKVPTYVTLGISVCFAVTFAIVELANFLWGAIWPDSKAIVESSSQVYLVSAISMLMGMGFGVVFGLVDVGEGVTDILELKRQLQLEETICYPLGGVIGGVGAVMNEFMRGRIADPHYAYEEVATTEDL